MSIAEMTETRQYLTFTLENEFFAIDIEQTLEVLEYKTITKVPRTPEYMVGVINIRGNVIPVVDMRIKFGMNKTQQTINTCIVIVELKINKEITVLGIVVDTVQEVFELADNQIEPAPKIGTQLNVEFIKGMGKKNEEFIIILDIDKIFSVKELNKVQQANQNMTAEKKTQKPVKKS